MIVGAQSYLINGLPFVIRSAEERDAEQLSALRVKIDGETEHMDREAGEAFIDAQGFRRLIADDSERPRNLFLVAETSSKLIGFARCEGSMLKRCAHKVEFGVCVAKAYWGHQVGRTLLQRSIGWADETGVKKITLFVLETNTTAIKLYQAFGFETEGVLRKDKLLSDGNYYSTIVMGRVTT